MESKLIDLAVLIVAFWGLLKWTVNRELKNIFSTMDINFRSVNNTLSRLEKQGDGHSKELRDMHARVSVLEKLGTLPGVFGAHKSVPPG